MQWRLKFSNLLCFVWVFRVISLMISERQQKMISPSSTKYVKHLLYSKLPRQTDQCLHGKHSNILHRELPEVECHCPVAAQSFCPRHHQHKQIILLLVLCPLRADILCWLNIVCLSSVSSVWLAASWAEVIWLMRWRGLFTFEMYRIVPHYIIHIPPSIPPFLGILNAHSLTPTIVALITSQSTSDIRYWWEMENIIRPYMLYKKDTDSPPDVEMRECLSSH